MAFTVVRQTRIWRMPNWWNDVLGVISCRCAYLGFRTCTIFRDELNHSQHCENAGNYTKSRSWNGFQPMMIWGDMKVLYSISKIKNISTRHAEEQILWDAQSDSHILGGIPWRKSAEETSHEFNTGDAASHIQMYTFGMYLFSYLNA